MLSTKTELIDLHSMSLNQIRSKYKQTASLSQNKKPDLVTSVQP